MRDADLLGQLRDLAIISSLGDAAVRNVIDLISGYGSVLVALPFILIGYIVIIFSCFSGEAWHEFWLVRWPSGSRRSRSRFCASCPTS